MSAVAAAPARQPGGPSLVTQARWAVSDSLMIAKRNLLVWMRVPAYLVFTVIQPVMFVLLFVYVFGGAKTIPSWAVIGMADHVIPASSQTFMAQRGGAHITDVNAGRLSLISKPSVVTRVILEAVQARMTREPAWCPANPAPGSPDAVRPMRRRNGGAMP